MTDHGRDRLRTLLDVVLDGTDASGGGAASGGASGGGAASGGASGGGAASDGPRRHVDDLADAAFSSPAHLSRLLSRATGEPPAAMRRRVLLERAAWQLAGGTSVTDAAWAAGYGSVDGFARAFGRAFGRTPSSPPTGSHWLPAPNGIHFHPPTSLWVRAEERPMNPLAEQLVAHDLDDTRALLLAAKGLPDEGFRARLQPGTVVLPWDGPEESIATVLEHQVFTKEIWVASIEGADTPARDPDPDVVRLLDRHDAVAPRWLDTVRDIDRRGAWNDRLVDALCDPPESFVMSSVIAHVLTFGAHRRQLVRRMLTASGHEVDLGDPILWLRERRGETT